MDARFLLILAVPLKTG